MTKKSKEQGDITVASAVVWLAGVMVAMLLGFNTFSLVEDTKVERKYDLENIGHHITLIGDSISVHAEKELKEQLPGVDFEAKSGIKFSEYREKFGEGGLTRLKKHAMRDVVVFLLGTNGSVSAKEINELRDYVGSKRQIILMTAYRDHEDMNKWNEVVYRYRNSYDNIHLVDWYIINFSNPDRYLLKDHVHPNADGCRYFASMVRQTVLEALEISE